MSEVESLRIATQKDAEIETQNPPGASQDEGISTPESRLKR